MRYLLLPFTIILTTCRTTGGPTVTVREEKTFQAQMQTMAQNVKSLVPYLYDRVAFRAEANHAAVDQALENFARASHAVTDESGKALVGDRLLVERSLGHLREDLDRALASFRAGQFEFARSAAKASLTSCFQCHSVTPPGHSSGWDLDQLRDLKLAPLEKADLLVATRQYERALSLTEDLLTDRDFQTQNAFDFEAVLRRYLALVIRVQVDPNRAHREMDRVLQKTELPRYLVDQITAWRTSLKTWSREPKKVVRGPRDLFNQVAACFSRAKRAQKFERDHAGDVEFLRATAILHNNLNVLSQPTDRARAFYLLGRAYEVLDDLGAWNLHEGYYEACLLSDRRGPWATTCYDRLEASLYMGFSGSAGTHLPSEERDRLKRLKSEIGAEP